MQVWLVEGGEKRGPFESYEVRERIENGELTGRESGWHEGCEEWCPLEELEMFRSEFERPVVEPPPLPKMPRPFSRLWARWFDLLLYLCLVLGGMILLDLDLLDALRSTWFQVLHLFPYLIFDALAVHVWGTTPGKALVGLRLQTADGGRLPLGASVLRSMRVYILGLGLGIPLLAIPCHVFALWFTMRQGEAPWDMMGGNEVRSRRVGPGRVVVFVVLFLLLFTLLGRILQPASERALEELRPPGPPAAEEPEA